MLSISTAGNCKTSARHFLRFDFPAAQHPKILNRLSLHTREATSESSRCRSFRGRRRRWRRRRHRQKNRKTAGRNDRRVIGVIGVINDPPVLWFLLNLKGVDECQHVTKFIHQAWLEQKWFRLMKIWRITGASGDNDVSCGLEAVENG